MSDNKKLLVVIDPGHTGNTYNAGAVKGYYESKAVYDLSLYEKAALEKRWIDVILTRERNQDPGLYERGQMAVKRGTDMPMFCLRATIRMHSMEKPAV